MSLQAMAHMEAMAKRLDAADKRLMTLAQAVEALAKHSEELAAQLRKLQEKRGPGRPPKHG